MYEQSNTCNHKLLLHFNVAAEGQISCFFTHEVVENVLNIIYRGNVYTSIVIIFWKTVCHTKDALFGIYTLHCICPECTLRYVGIGCIYYAQLWTIQMNYIWNWSAIIFASVIAENKYNLKCAVPMGTVFQLGNLCLLINCH